MNGSILILFWMVMMVGSVCLATKNYRKRAWHDDVLFLHHYIGCIINDE